MQWIPNAHRTRNAMSHAPWIKCDDFRLGLNIWVMSLHKFAHKSRKPLLICIRGGPTCKTELDLHATNSKMACWVNNMWLQSVLSHVTTPNSTAFCILPFFRFIFWAIYTHHLFLFLNVETGCLMSLQIKKKKNCLPPHHDPIMWTFIEMRE